MTIDEFAKKYGQSSMIGYGGATCSVEDQLKEDMQKLTDFVPVRVILKDITLQMARFVSSNKDTELSEVLCMPEMIELSNAAKVIRRMYGTNAKKQVK